MSLFVFNLYRWFLVPMALVLLWILRPFLRGKLAEMIHDRLGPQWPALTARPICLHASSGEVEYAKSVIRLIKEIYPHIPVLVTYSSPSAKKLLKNFPGVDAMMALPWDSRKGVELFLSRFHPLMILYARTDVWPELATQARQNKIPQLLFAATLSPSSSRLRFPQRWLTQWSFDQLEEIHCVSPEDQMEFESLDCDTPVQVTGDTRYDQVLFRLNHPGTTKKLNTHSNPIFIAGSTWHEDENVLVPALQTWTKAGGSCILAPHEVGENRIRQIESDLQRKGFSTKRYSQAESWQGVEILILDQIGILQEIYLWGRLAFVGGSFKDKVHSVMEPLACGLPVIVGPLHTNNREALNFQNFMLDGKLRAVHVVHNTNELSQALAEFWKLQSFPEKCAKLSGELKNKVQSMAGASLKVLRFIDKQLPN